MYLHGRPECAPRYLGEGLLIATFRGEIRFRVEIQKDERNSEQWSQQCLHQAEQEAGEVESLRLVVGRERLEQSLGILGCAQLVKIMPDRGPLRPDGEREHKRRPD